VDTAQLVRVEIHPAVETLHTSVSRDVSDDYYEVPEPLVAAYEQARAALDRAEEALASYIDEHGLEPRYQDDDPEED